jgi:RNA 2',3'-cyclic 3'-phosphodiesterase
MKRTFLAIEIEINNRISDVYKTFLSQLANEKIKWVKPTHFHITLCFLGDTHENEIPKITDILSQSIKHVKQFSIQIAGCGVFPNINNPRVLWFGINQGDQLIGLKDIIDDSIYDQGFPDEKREFHPHLTIGRIKEIKNVNTLKKLIHLYKGEFFAEQTISELVFFESRLSPAGPVYSRISEFPFK